MLLAFQQEKWLASLTSKPPLEASKKSARNLIENSANPSTLKQTIAKTHKKLKNLQYPTPKRQNFFEENSVAPAFSKEKSTSKALSVSQSSRKSSKNSAKVIGNKKNASSKRDSSLYLEKGNQTVNEALEFPGENSKKTWVNDYDFSRLNQENIRVNGLFYKNDDFFQVSSEKQHQEQLLKDYLRKMRGFKEEKKEFDSLYIENLCNIQEKDKHYEVIEMKNTEKPTKSYEKIINLHNNEEIPFTFPDKLPGNNLCNRLIFPSKQIKAAICIQKIARGYLQRKKNKPKKTSLLNRNIFEKCLQDHSDHDQNDESFFTFEKTVKFSRKPINSDLISTKKLEPRPQPDTFSDGLSVISLFLKGNPRKLPEISDFLPVSFEKTEKKSQKTGITKEKIRIEEKISYHEETSKILKDSLIKESIEEIMESSVNNNTIMEESALNRNKSELSYSNNYEDEKFESISEDKSLKNLSFSRKEQSKDNKDASYMYEDEKFESISEDKSLKLLSSSFTKKEEGGGGSMEDSKSNQNQKKIQSNMKKNSDSTAKNPLVTAESNKTKKSVNFTQEIKTSKEPEEKFVENILNKPHEDLKRHIDQTTRHLNYAEEIPYKDLLLEEARNKIDAFNRHDGELSQLKHQLFHVLDELQYLSQRKPSHIPNKEPVHAGNDLYNRFQSEFSRLMNLKQANEVLAVYEEINSKNRVKSALFEDIKDIYGSKEGKPSEIDNRVAINEIKNKQEVIFQTLLTVLQNNNSNQGLRQDLERLKENQDEILKQLVNQHDMIENISKKPLYTLENQTQEKRGILFEEQQQESPYFIEKKSQEEENHKKNIGSGIEKNIVLKEISRKQEEKKEIQEKKPENPQIYQNNFIQKRNEMQTSPKERQNEVVSSKKTIEEDEEIEEYIDDFEMSTPHVPNVQVQKSFELNKSPSPVRPNSERSAIKSEKSQNNELSLEINPLNSDNNNKNNNDSKENTKNVLKSMSSNENLTLEQLKSMSLISSDKEIDMEDEFSSISWQNIMSPMKLPQNTNNLQANKEKLLDNLTEFVIETMLEDTLSAGNMFPKRNMKEIQKIIDNLSQKPLPSPLKPKKSGINMENFEEKSPTKLKSLKKSTDDLLRSSLEMSVRNEGFINETEKAVRSLESKLKRRNNEQKIAEAVRLINEDIYNKINLFNENDVKEKGDIIIEAFNEQLKMNIIKELNDFEKKQPFFGDFKQSMGEQIIKKKFNKIATNTKKALLKSAQNQLKENEIYNNVQDFDFDKLYEFFKKEKYPLEEEENLEMLEFQINENWNEFRKGLETEVLEECFKDVIMELNRLNKKKK